MTTTTCTFSFTTGRNVANPMSFDEIKTIIRFFGGTEVELVEVDEDGHTIVNLTHEGTFDCSIVPNGCYTLFVID